MDDLVDDTSATIETSSAEVVILKFVIPGVGWLIQFHGTEGNVICTMHKDRDTR